MKRITTSLLLALLIPVGMLNGTAQTQVGLKTVEVQGEKQIDEKAIEALAFQVLNAEKDEERLVANEELKAMLKNELSKESAFRFPFSGIQSISILTPLDSAFRIFNWNIPFNDGTYDYECGILKQVDNTTATSLEFLSPINADSVDAQKITTAHKQWLPGLFYELIEKETKLQTYYTLLAWEGNDRLTTKKRIELLWFDQEGAIRFGAPIFEVENQKLNRVQYEFSAQNIMELTFDEKNNRILLDHLSPPNSSLKGIYEYYGADLSYDAYYWEKNKWVYQADVDADEGIKKSKKDFKLDEEIILEQEDIYSPK